MSSRRSVLATIAASAVTPITTVSAISGCSGPHRAPSTSLDTVTYVTGFGILGREGYPWVAQAKGYFRDAGIQVTINPGQAGDFNLKALDSGQAQFTILDFAKALSTLGAGHQTFRLLGAIQQRTIVSLMTLEGKGITRPSDLQGRTIAQAPGTVVKILFPAYANLANFDPKTVRWVEAQPTQLPGMLVSGQVDAIGQFVVGKPALQAAAKGRGVVVLPYGDYISDLYGNVLITSTNLASRSPDLVGRFTTALLQGLAYSVANPEESGQIMHHAQPVIDPVVAAAELRLMNPYTTAPRTFGALDPGRVMKGISLLESLGVIASGVLTPERVVDFTAAARTPVGHG